MFGKFKEGVGHVHKVNVCPEIRNNISYVSHDLSITMHLALPLAKKDRKRSIYFVPTVELVLWETKKKNETIMCPREVYGPVGWRGSPLLATRAEAGLTKPKVSDPEAEVWSQSRASMDGSPNLCEAEVKVRVGPARYGQKGGRTESNQGGMWVWKNQHHRSPKAGGRAWTHTRQALENLQRLMLLVVGLLTRGFGSPSLAS